MIQTPRQCPPETELIDYLLGKLPEDRWPRLESHFQDCRVCEETMRGLSASDTLSQFVGQAAANIDSEPHDLPFVSGLIERLQQTTRDLALEPSVLRDRANEVLQLLDDPQQPNSMAQLGEYRIEELIGAGSTGVVFRAVDGQLDRRVALKVLRPSLGDAARRRFMAEARAAASIEHPNVITIWQVGQHNALAFIAMHWLPGETLEDRLARSTVVSEDQVRDIAMQVATGLRAAHNQTLIHRDIKPANIWLCEASDQAIILDFGLARIADDDPHMTSTGMLAGTPNFMSPEQTRGQELDGRSDLFSLGCLMYRAATGKLPFGAGGVLATLQSIQHHHPPLPRELNPNLSPDFSDLIMCLLEKQPANRPAHADDLLHALSHPRGNWRFAAMRYSSQPTKAMTRVQSQPIAFTRSRRWIIAATLATLLAAGAYAFGEQIIRIATNQGEIVIQTNDKNVQVEILSAGEIVKIVDTSTQQQIDIQAGEYEITARDPNNANGEFRISNNHIVLTRGGRQVVSVTMVDSGGSLVPPTTALAEPIFEGRTFDEWLPQLSRERSKTAIAKVTEALGTLSRGNPTLQYTAIDALRPLIRVHGNNKITNGGDWTSIFNRFFGFMPPELVVEFAIEEIQNGTPASLGQVLWNVSSPGQIYQGEFSSQIDDHYKAIRKNLELIVDRGIAEIEQESSGNDRDAIRNLVAAAIYACFPNKPNFADGRRVEIEPDFVRFLENKIQQSGNIAVRRFLAYTLTAHNVFSPLVVQTFCDSLADRNVSDELTSSLYFDHLNLLPDADFEQAIPAMITIFESDELCDRLVAHAKRIAAGNRFGGSGGFGGGGLGGGTFVGGGQVDSELLKSDPPRPASAQPGFVIPVDRTTVRADILYRIGQRGEFASTALPWLDRIAASESLLKTHAAIAAKKVRGEDSGTDNQAASEGSEGDTPADPIVMSGNSNSPTGVAGDTDSLKTDPEPLYSGRTFDDWVNELTRERSRAAVETGFTALGELSRGDAKKQERAIEVATPLIRIHGNMDNQSGWPDVFNSFLSYLPPDRVVQFVIDEIERGTSQSRSQSMWLVIVGTIYEGQGKPQAKHRAAIGENLNRIIDAGCDQIEGNPTDVDNAIIRILMSTAIETTFSTASASGQSAFDQVVEKNIPHLVHRLTTSHNSETREFLAKVLVSNYANQVAIVSNAFNDMLGDPDLSSKLTGIIYFEHLASTSGFASNQTIPSLIRIFESDLLCDRVLKYLENNQTTIRQSRGRSGGLGDLGGSGGGRGDGGGGIGGRDPADILDSDPERTSTPGSDSRFPSGRDAVRADILFAIGNKLARAAKLQQWLDEEAAGDSPKKQQFVVESASLRETTSVGLSWLDKIAASESPLKQHAVAAARKIRGEDSGTDGAGDENGSDSVGIAEESSGGNSSAGHDPPSTETDNSLHSGTEPTPTYEGKTFKEWRELIKTERRFETVQKGLNALGSLSTGETALQEIAIEFVRPMFRSPDDQFAKKLPGDFSNFSAQSMHDVFDQFFSYLPPERVVKFATNEIGEGTIDSRKRLYTLLTDTGVHNNPELRQRFKQAVNEHADEIVGAVFDMVERHPEELQYASYILQGSLGAAYFKQVPNASGGYVYQSALSESMISRLEQAMNATSNEQWAVQLCWQLLQFEIFSNAVQEKLTKNLSHPAIRLNQVYFDTFPKLAKSHGAELVAPLIAIYESDELTDQLASQQHYLNRIEANGSGAMFGSTPTVEKTNEPTVNRVTIRADIIHRIGEFGAAGSTALPWLDDIATGDSALKQHAATAARKVRGEDAPKEDDQGETTPAEPVSAHDGQLTQELLKTLVSKSLAFGLIANGRDRSSRSTINR